MRPIVLALAPLILAGCATTPASKSTDGWSETSGSTEEVCAIAQCAYDVHISLQQKDGKTFNKTFPALPVVQQGMVSIYPGTPVSFEADLDGDRLVNLRLVKEVVDPTKTLTATLSQGEKGAMTLVTRNPFGKALRIRMGVMPLDSDHLLKTSSCPVNAGGASYELWPYPVFQVVLADLHLVELGDTMVCTE